ncbi:hypothetical protein VSDG_00259 [Cytospora chrysosperma]|uniref:FAS1 domain-containing protein n=1 Tax=Cytospora chrysosperma TaxID=252740 RepID=A0A423WPB5_CYTCH|nr:hypothetical protein VSDG_00259 [Valsa sordida]
MLNMTLFKIIVNIAFAVLLAGRTINFAAAEVVTSAANAVASGTSSEVPGATQLQVKGIVPHGFSVPDLLSFLSKESIARTRVLSTITTLSTTATPSGNTSVSMSPFATANHSITSNVTQAQTKAVLALDTYFVGLVSTHTPVSVTPLMTASFTLTLPSTPSNGSAPSTVGSNSSTSATVSVPFGDTNFTVTFTRVSPTGTDQAHSVSLITRPSQLTWTTPAAPSPSTDNGGSKGAKPVSCGLVAVIVYCLVGVLYWL